MQFDGFAVDKWKARVSGTIDITEDEGKLMRLDRVVVAVCAFRVTGSPPKLLDEEGNVELTRVNKIEHLAILEGDMREQALVLLSNGTERGLQQALDLSTAPALDTGTGEVSTGFASYVPDRGDDIDELRSTAAHLPPPGPPELEDTLEAPTPVEASQEPAEEPEYFDVPVVHDDSEPVGTGNVRDYATAGARPAGGNGSGPQAGKVDYDELASLGAPAASAGVGPSVPRGTVVGSIHPPGHKGDQALEDFFATDPEEIE